MKFKNLACVLFLLLSNSVYAMTHLECNATVSEYVTTGWQNAMKPFSFDVKPGIGMTVSTVNLKGYEISAVVKEKDYFTVPTVADQLTLVVVRKDVNGIYKFHSNSSTFLPLVTGSQFELVGWDFSGRSEKFDIGISLKCR